MVQIKNIQLRRKKKKTKTKTKTKLKTQEKYYLLQIACPNQNQNGYYYEDNLVLPIGHAWLIWHIAFIHFLSSMYAIYRQYYIFVPIDLGAVATSLNYWRYPKIKCWQRYVDIIYVQFCLYSHLYYAIYSTMMEGYLFFTIIGMSSYLVSNYYISRNIYYATLFHIGVHIMGFVGNVALYSGEMIS